jgi:AraC-like DNA-binding protein
MDLPHVMHASELHPARQWVMPAHAHDGSHELVLVIAGQVETAMAGSTTVAGPGVCKFHPSRVPHAERAVGGQPVRLLLVAWREAPGYDVSRLPREVADRSGRLRLLMEWMIELDPGPARQRTLDGLLEVFLAAYGGGTGEGGALAKVRRQVRERLAEPLRLADLAAMAGMSPFHFARTFKRETGTSPMAWIRDLRVEAARALLLSTALPLRTIATQVGFSDESLLSRSFRAVTGQSPREVRQGMAPR